ncbi:MAG TPA: hypothetical protein VG604_02940 [Candidatus Saccharimonadales bacterium]|nr:hypothetical protein [Candidatus Saccharimonadales bacterium]
MARQTTTSTRTFKTSLEVENQAPKKTKRQLKVPSIQLPWAIVIVLVLFSAFMYQQYHEAKTKSQASSSAEVNRQANNTISKVQKLAAVPTNEVPTVAPIKDLSKLKSQSFFAHAKVGDVVLVYGKAKEAVLYRPSTNQIVTISNVSVDSTKQ